MASKPQQMTPAQSAVVRQLEAQGFAQTEITRAGIGMAKGNDYRVVCSTGRVRRGVGAKR